jgi:tetratricopeptide (TPR) repeat protein
VVRSHIAAIRFQERRFADAEAMLAKVLSEQERAGRTADLQHASTLNNYGLVLLRLEDPARLEEAESAFLRATKLREQLLPDGNADLAAAFNNLAVARYTMEKYAEAAEAFRAAANCTALVHGRGHAGVALLRLNEARSLMNAGKPSTASQVITGALADVGRSLPPDHPHVVALKETSGLLLNQLLQSISARLVFEELEQTLLTSPHADPWVLARVRVGLATARVMLRDADGAEAALGLALVQLELDPAQEPEVLDQARRLQSEVARLRGLAH